MKIINIKLRNVFVLILFFLASSLCEGDSQKINNNKMSLYILDEKNKEVIPVVFPKEWNTNAYAFDGYKVEYSQNKVGVITGDPTIFYLLQMVEKKSGVKVYVNDIWINDLVGENLNKDIKIVGYGSLNKPETVEDVLMVVVSYMQATDFMKPEPDEDIRMVICEMRLDKIKIKWANISKTVAYNSKRKNEKYENDAKSKDDNYKLLLPPENR